MNPPRHLSALRAICDTFIPYIQNSDDPHGYWARSASDANVAERILEAIKKIKEEDQIQFRQLLDLLASPLLGLSWFGPLKPADKLSPAQRALLLRRWAASPLSDLRNGYNSLRKLVGLVYFGDVPGPGQPNPNWKTIGYEPLESSERQDPAPLKVEKISADTTLHCQVLVIGSGASGSIVAAQQAAAGKDVIVVDKGGYAPTHAMDQREFPSLQRHFEAGGLLTSTDGGMTVLAGSTLGGGTTINWAATLRTPDYVLEEWATQGNPHFLDKAYQEGFDFVEKRNGVNTLSQHNQQNLSLMEAAQALGYQAKNIPLNVRFPNDVPAQTAWKALGFSCYGDRFGIKQGAAQTFLHDAAQAGARLFQHVEIQRLVIEKGAVLGAVGRMRKPGSGEYFTVNIKAEKVVLAAGALHTPVLLLKSGLRHPQIGRNLFLHPVAATGAFNNGDTLPWYGPMMSAIVTEFERLDGNYGVRLECPPLHPGLAAFALSWENGESFKTQMAQIRRLSVNIVLARDKFGGRVTVGKRSGQPVIHYKLSDYDKKHLLRGLEETVRLHRVAGAEQVMVMHNQPVHYSPKTDKLEDCLAAIHRRKWRPNDFGLFSAHQMGTCRMGGNPDAPVQPNGETREIRNLFVADGSLFPSASGVNPMLSIQALGYYVAQML